MKKGRKSTLITVVFMTFIVGLLFYGFLRVRESGKNSEENKTLTEVEKLLERDLEKNYPGNAREVIKFYNRILKCYYNEELSEEELAALAGQARFLYDTELLKRNPWDSFFESLKTDITAYKEAKRTISNTALQDYRDIRFEKKGSENTASLLSSYLLSEKGEKKTSYIRYYLREDEAGKWRILFWELTDESFE